MSLAVVRHALAAIVRVGGPLFGCLVPCSSRGELAAAEQQRLHERMLGLLTAAIGDSSRYRG
ncbi:hypothetical protein [Benzoatithermus flavus]|uniref:Uncharacterized protein n=1 Tax=Benzoatithermus flavus TaxID=3108223 RepID=A0ABU8XUB2_9PROT